MLPAVLKWKATEITKLTLWTPSVKKTPSPSEASPAAAEAAAAAAAAGEAVEETGGAVEGEETMPANGGLF